MSEPTPHFTKPRRIEKIFNSVMGFLVGLGIGPTHMRVLEVRGRKSGKLYRLPVDLLDQEGRLFLVAPRGRTQWVRNVEAQGQATLRRGRHSTSYKLRPLPVAEKPPILKAYLDQFHREVQPFFPVRAGSPVDAFVELTDRYPAFELELMSAS